MVTVTKSTSVPKDTAEMKIIAVSAHLEGQTRRCEAMLHFEKDPNNRQALMLLKQDLLDDRAKLKDALKELDKRRLSAQN